MQKVVCIEWSEHAYGTRFAEAVNVGLEPSLKDGWKIVQQSVVSWGNSHRSFKGIFTLEK